MKNIATLTPVFYITDDNKKIIKEIEKKLDLIFIDDSDKKENYKLSLRLDQFIHH